MKRTTRDQIKITKEKMRNQFFSKYLKECIKESYFYLKQRRFGNNTVALCIQTLFALGTHLSLLKVKFTELRIQICHRFATFEGSMDMLNKARVS